MELTLPLSLSGGLSEQQRTLGAQQRLCLTRTHGLDTLKTRLYCTVCKRVTRELSLGTTVGYDIIIDCL